MKILLGTNELDKDKILKMEESKGFIIPKKFGLDESFYGGRVENLAKTQYAGVYLVIEKGEVIDLLVNDITSLTKSQICFFAKRKFKKELNVEDKKDDLIKQLKQLI